MPEEIPKSDDEFAPHNVGMVTLGTIILWFGWYGFNAGSTTSVTGENERAVALICVTTTLSAAASGLTTFLLYLAIDKVESVPSTANGILAGLVGITASCNAVTPIISLCIGVVSAAVY